MDNVNDHPNMVLKLASERMFAGDPFVLFDVGCGLGNPREELPAIFNPLDDDVDVV
jgi:hypothetical protein